MVRPWIRRLGLWGGPTLLLILGWQTWDRREETLLAREAPRFEKRTVNDAGPLGAGAGRYYVAANILVDFRGPGFGLMAAAREALRQGKAPAQTVRDDLAQLAVRFEPTASLMAQAAPLPFGSMNSLESASDQRGHDADNAYAVVMLNRMVQGRMDSAVQDVVSRLRYLRVFDWNVGWSTGADKVFTTASAVNDLSLVLGRVEMTAGQMTALDDALASSFQSDELERVMEHHVEWLNAALAKTWSNPGQLTPLGWPLRPLLRRQARTLMRTLADCREVARRPWPERLTAMRLLTVTPAVGPELLWNPELILGECRSDAELYALGEVKVRSARVALRLERYRLEHGDWPATLDMLGDAQNQALLDPFTGKSLIYRRQPNGFIVYSVGKDLRDDGGALAPVPVPGGTVMSPDTGLAITIHPARAAR